jgi:Salt stress response/antifungal
LPLLYNYYTILIKNIYIQKYNFIFFKIPSITQPLLISFSSLSSCPHINAPVCKYTTSNTYLPYLNNLFLANSTDNGFTADIVGTKPDQVSGLTLCRGDINVSTCSSCLSQIYTVAYIFFKKILVLIDFYYSFFSYCFSLVKLAMAPPIFH